ALDEQVVAGQFVDELAADLVQTHLAVGSAGDYVLPVGREGNAGDELGVPLERANVLAGVGLPETNVLVAARGGRQFAVGAEGDGPDHFGVAGVGAQLAARLDIPDLDSAVLASAGQAFAITAVGDAEDPVRVSQTGVAEDAGDMLGEVGGQGRNFPP